MRTLGALAAHVAQPTTTLCNMLRIDCRDGTSLGLTDHDKDLTFDEVDGSLLYRADIGILPSDVSLSIGLDADNFEVKLPIDDVIILGAVLGGKYDRARVKLFQVNWNTLADHAPILAGNVAEVRVEGGTAILAIRSDMDRYNQTIGRLITPYCDADFGDARCGVTPETIVGTVTAVTDAMVFTVSFTGTYADDFFNQGTVLAVTGLLAGTAPVEIFDWTSAGVITLFTFLADTPQIGDEFTISRGCSKLRRSDDPSVPTCMTYDNIANFRGFPEVPGSDQVLKLGVPGSEGA